MTSIGHRLREVLSRVGPFNYCILSVEVSQHWHVLVRYRIITLAIGRNDPGMANRHTVIMHDTMHKGKAVRAGLFAHDLAGQLITTALASWSTRL